jgi:hypothetical protein
MKKFAKRLLFAIAPRLMIGLQSARARAYSHRLMRGWGCVELNRQLIERFGAAVLEGPFAGLVLTPATHAEHLGPYLLGVYESELDESWEVLLLGRYSQILDVGAKFGYYAVGLARRFPTIPVIAFDTDQWARRALREMSARNAANNVEVRGYCGPEWLAKNGAEGALIVSDCEGFEAELLSGDALPRLATATLLIETHDHLVPGVTSRLQSTFEPTHVVRRVGENEQRRSTTRNLDWLPVEKQKLANHEIRGVQSWLVCLPKNGPNAVLSSTTLTSDGTKESVPS